MKHIFSDGLSHRRWRFRVHADASRVLLVRQQLDGISHWTEMRQRPDGWWELDQSLDEGVYRFNYYLMRGKTCLNGGDAGLIVERLDPEAPGTASTDDDAYGSRLISA